MTTDVSRMLNEQASKSFEYQMLRVMAEYIIAVG